MNAEELTVAYRQFLERAAFHDRHFDAMEAALRLLYRETADYIQINNLGLILQNNSMRQATVVLLAIDKERARK